MEPVTTTIAAVAVTKLVAEAVSAIGDKVFDKTTDAVADGSVGLGWRLVDRLLHRTPAVDAADPPRSASTGRQVALREALNELVAAPGDQDAQAAVRVSVRRLLDADPELFAQVRELLPTSTTTASGERSVAIGGNSGVIVTGDERTFSGASPKLAQV